MTEFAKIEIIKKRMTNYSCAGSSLRLLYNLILKTFAASAFILSLFSCGKEPIIANFEDQRKLTIYDYIKLNKDNYSSFLSILESGKADKMLSAYNPNSTGYTLFLPDNAAVNKFIQDSEKYSSLQDLLADTEYIYILSRYHIVNINIRTDDFPFGALPEYTLSGDRLTVSFVIEPDTSYYKINNQSPVILQDIELSNGYIQVISSLLEPIVHTTYDWIEQHPAFSIFKEAVDATGLKTTFDLNAKDENSEGRPFTLLVEPDSVFNKNNIYSFEDLANLISPGNSDYTNIANPLNNFLRYHLLTDTRFLDDFSDVITNYTTYSEIPLLINGKELDIAINKGKQNFDTIISGIDTTIIDYVGFYYDNSNVLTQSGVIHLIDQVLQQKQPSRANMYFSFYEEPLFNEFRAEPYNEFIIEDSSVLKTVKFSGADLFFVSDPDFYGSGSYGDYLLINGDFTISYSVPKIVQGLYTVWLSTNVFNTQNAIVEVSIDGKKMGGLVDLTTGGSADWSIREVNLGQINFVKYAEHTIQIKALIPGFFLWDYIRFEPL